MVDEGARRFKKDLNRFLEFIANLFDNKEDIDAVLEAVRTSTSKFNCRRTLTLTRVGTYERSDCRESEIIYYSKVGAAYYVWQKWRVVGKRLCATGTSASR